MVFHPFEVSVAHLAYTILGAFIVIFGAFSLAIKERLYIGEAPIATVIGIIVGPYCAGIFDPASWAKEEVADEITLEVTRIIIAVSVFAIGVELPKAYMWKHWRTMVMLLGPCMLWGWMITALLMWGLFPHLEFLSCLFIAAAVTPTDPILAQAVIGGKFADKHVPAHIRHMLSAESGSNDGAAFPFLGLALYLTLDRSVGKAIGTFWYFVVVYEVLLGIIIGGLLGWVARRVMKFSEAKGLIDRQSLIAQYISLAVLATGMTSLLGSDDLLSAFACGCAFAWDGFFNKATEEVEFSNVIDLLFNCTAFIYIGAIIPFDSFNDHEIHIDWWRLVVLGICVLLLRRLPAILALYRWIPDIKTFREACFTGWFGPMGVGAIFIGTLAKTEIPPGKAEHNTEQVDLLRECIMPIISFLVLTSVITHGLSIPFFSLGRRVHSLTYTWSRNPSMDTRNEPAWTTHARRVIPGQNIVVNRDDDAEEGDLGVRQMEKPSNSLEREKAGRSDESGGSSSSRTAGREEAYEMDDRAGSSGSNGSHHGNDEAPNDEHEDGRNTPTLAEFREGNHLIIERRTGDDSDEVEVEVIRNHFHPKKEAEREVFRHPSRLASHEMDRLRSALPKSLQHATSRVKDGGAEPIDPMGLGLMHSHTSSEASAANSRASSPWEEPRSDSPEPIQEGEASGSPSQARPPAIKIDSGKKKEGLRQRLFGKLGQSSSADPDVEQGRAAGDSGLLAPPESKSRPKPIPTNSGSNDDSLSRSISNRNTSIRFAEDSAASSETAPALGNYGNNAPGFKKTPGLAMYRSTSVQSSSSARDRETSISFQEPEKPR